MNSSSQSTIHPCVLALGVALGTLACGSAAASTPAPAGLGLAGLIGMQSEQPQTQAEGEERREYQLRRRLLDATAGEEAWEPEMGVPSFFNADAIIDEAEQAARQGRIYEPPEDNALARYLQVLEREPDNARANAGVDTLVASLLDQARQAVAAGGLAEATRLLAVVSRVRPADARVAALRAEIDAARELERVLLDAEQALAAGRLIEPAETSALSLFRRAQSQAPDDPRAAQGLAAVEAALVDAATATLAAGRLDEAAAAIESAAAALPGSAAVAEARQRLQQARVERADALLAEARQALEALDADRAEALANQAEALSPQAPGLPAVREGVVSVRAYASLRPGQAITDDGRGQPVPEVVVVPIGNFQMGSPADEPGRSANEGPLQTIRFTRGFALSRTEITVGQFAAFVAATNFRTDAERQGSSVVYDEETGQLSPGRNITWRNDYSGGRARDDHPVVHVSWNDARAYTEWLSQITGQRYRLPSEAEFEYALRAGSATRYWWGDGPPTRLVENLTGDGDRSPSRRSWSNAFPNYNDRFWGPGPVASFPANPFGLHDMGGNVSEWTLDCWDESLAGTPADGRPRETGNCSRRTIRGGSWFSNPDQARSATRLNAPQDWRGPQVGFRVLRELL